MFSPSIFQTEFFKLAGSPSKQAAMQKFTPMATKAKPATTINPIEAWHAAGKSASNIRDNVRDRGTAAGFWYVAHGGKLAAVSLMQQSMDDATLLRAHNNVNLETFQPVHLDKDDFHGKVFVVMAKETADHFDIPFIDEDLRDGLSNKADPTKTATWKPTHLDPYSPRPTRVKLDLQRTKSPYSHCSRRCFQSRSIPTLQPAISTTPTPPPRCKPSMSSPLHGQSP